MYTAISMHTVDSRENVPMASRILISYLEQKSLGDDIVDLTFKLAGDSDDELPERPLGTARFVHCQPSAYPLSAAFIAPQYQNIQSQLATFGGRATQRDPVSLYLRVFLTDPFHAATDAVARQVSSLKLSLVSPVPPLSPASCQAQVLKTSERASVVASRDPFEKAINELIEILKDVIVPVRMEISTTGTARPNSDSTYGSWTNATSVDVAIRTRGDIQQVPVLERVSRSDILRFFIASRCSLKTTAVRLVESTAWRGLTFPIDTRMCRLELHNGQFFQQGVDKSNHPVFYFRNTCLGPWRKNEDALIGAVLHRLEASLQVFEQGRSGTRCTLVVLMGRPYRKTKSRQNYPGERHSHSIMHESSVSLIGQEDHDNGEDLESELDINSSDEEIEDAATVEDKKKVLSNNPRISPSEHWHTHTNKTVVTRLVDLLLTHYPERLHRALVVTGNGDTSYASTFVGSLFALSSLVKSSKTREKVKFVRRYKDLREYVDKDELVTLAGGSAKLEPKVFEC
jgi:Divergent CRAL/TRIO domain